jgi:hypothetical protein
MTILVAARFSPTHKMGTKVTLRVAVLNESSINDIGKLHPCVFFPVFLATFSTFSAHV